MSARGRDPLIVGRNIRALRLARGLSQGALAGKVGVSYQQLQKYERGENRVGADRLARIAETLGVPVAILLDSTVAGERAVEVPALHFLAELDAMRLVRAFARIKDRELRWSIVEFVEDVAAARERK